MAKRLTDRSFQLCGAAPAPDPHLDTARQMFCERGYSSRVGMDDEFVRLYHDHHAAHAAAAHAAVAEAKVAGVDDPGMLFEVGGRAFLYGSWLRRDLALLFSSGDGPRDFIPVRKHLRDAWTRRNALLFHLDNSPDATSINCKWIGDRASFFLDGKLAGTFDAKPDSNRKIFEVPLSISAGAHDLAVFVSHAGRDKYYNYTGSLDRLESHKGLTGPVTYGKDMTAVITSWKMSGGVDPANPNLPWSAPASTNGAPAYYRTHIRLDTLPEPGATYRLATTGLSGGSVWLNGHNLGRYPEILRGCPGIWLPNCWMKVGDNSLVIFDEQGNSPEQTSVQLEQSASRHRLVLGAP